MNKILRDESKPLHNAPSIKYPTSLAKYLRVPWDLLEGVSLNIPLHWRPGKTKKKPNGTKRITNSATEQLKSLHKKINSKILSRVTYPAYLFGGLKNNLDGTPRNHIFNAKLHQNNRLLISADIAAFFPWTKEQVIKNIWQSFFPFSPEVAILLTKLTVYKGCLPQGWGNSAYLSQLVFWNTEHLLYKKLLSEGITYSRYIDDFALSTNLKLTDDELTDKFKSVIMLCMDKGLRLNSKKFKVMSGRQQKIIHKLGLTRKGIFLSQKYRSNVSARVHRLMQIRFQIPLARWQKEKNRLLGQIAYIGNFHPQEAKKLKKNLT